jgi:hypothetical protein
MNDLTVRVSALLACAAGALAQTPKLLVIGVDGLRPDAMLAADAPNIDRLIAEGSFSASAQAEDLTFSGPGWSSILHGVHRDKHNVTTNSYGGNRLDQYPDILAHIETHDPARVTVRITTWDAIYIHQPTGADIDIFHDYTSNGDLLGTADAVALLLGAHHTYTDDPDAMFVYFADADIAGHTHGFDPRAQGYLDEIANVDGQIGQILNAIGNRPGYANERWLVILTSDHGGSADGSHSGNTPEKRTVPFIVSESGAVTGEPFPEANIVDVMPTALTHMGVPITPQMSLDGRAIGLEQTAPAAPEFGVNLLFNADAEFDRGVNDQAIDFNVSGWDDPGPGGITPMPYGAPGGFPTQTDPGPPDRAVNFFCGGTGAVTTMTQAIRVDTLADGIDTGDATFALSGWLGGYSSQNDRAEMLVRFLSSTGSELGSAQIGPVTNADRANQTGLLYREALGVVPIGTRIVEAELICRRSSGANDGYADNLSIVLEGDALCRADFNGDGVVNSQDFVEFLNEFVRGCGG